MSTKGLSDDNVENFYPNSSSYFLCVACSFSCWFIDIRRGYVCVFDSTQIYLVCVLQGCACARLLILLGQIPQIPSSRFFFSPISFRSLPVLPNFYHVNLFITFFVCRCSSLLCVWGWAILVDQDFFQLWHLQKSLTLLAPPSGCGVM